VQWVWRMPRICRMLRTSRKQLQRRGRTWLCVSRRNGADTGIESANCSATGPRSRYPRTPGDTGYTRSAGTAVGRCSCGQRSHFGRLVEPQVTHVLRSGQSHVKSVPRDALAASDALCRIIAFDRHVRLVAGTDEPCNEITC
jgi:hypothetical protein